MHKLCLVTGCSGLIGSEVTAFFHENGFKVHGVDNNQREKFFGPQGNTRWNQERTGDHICYYSDLRKMKTHYPKRDSTCSLKQIFEEIVASWRERLRAK
jgi:nucleoside-diphosphate-sugar epimerase